MKAIKSNHTDLFKQQDLVVLTFIVFVELEVTLSEYDLQSCNLFIILLSTGETAKDNTQRSLTDAAVEFLNCSIRLTVPDGT